MFSRTPNDLARTVEAMLAHATQECRYDQYAAIERTAQLIRQDRRFDNIGMTPAELAKEAAEAKQSGRTMRLGPKPIELNPMPATYTGR
jgi:hypothetical protein